MTATTTTELKLPTQLADLDLKFSKALNEHVPALWPEGEGFQKAEQPEAIAKILIQTKLHDRLVNAKLVYLYRENINQAGRARLAVTSRASKRVEFLLHVHFILEFNHTEWLRLTKEQRLACVDHALSACDRDLETGAYSARLPDVAEFSGVVQRWGLWTPPLRGFGVAIESAQIELFVPQLPPITKEKAPRDLAEEARDRIKRGGR